MKRLAVCEQFLKSTTSRMLGEKYDPNRRRVKDAHPRRFWAPKFHAAWRRQLPLEFREAGGKERRDFMLGALAISTEEFLERPFADLRHGNVTLTGLTSNGAHNVPRARSIAFPACLSPADYHKTGSIHADQVGNMPGPASRADRAHSPVQKPDWRRFNDGISKSL